MKAPLVVGDITRATAALAVPEAEPDARPLSEGTWHGPGAPASRRRFRWTAVLWALLYPPRGHRVYPTVSGIILISLAMGIGTAAYNTANNILFITLALLLSCLILSGVLSWMNLSRIAWRFRLEPSLRSGQETVVALEVRNAKRLIPTYGLQFEVVADGRPGPADSLFLRERLDPEGGRVSLERPWRPERRGRVRVELARVTSLFPFGFLRKSFPGDLSVEAIVWPAPVSYQLFPVLSSARPYAGKPVERVGQSGDLHALRRYASGDSHRLIHWKASARSRQWLVRQFSSENQDGFSLWIDPSRDLWPRPEQFELLVGLVATLAEDLFKQGRLGRVIIGAEPARLIRRLQDVEALLDRLAVLEPEEAPGHAEVPARTRSRSMLVFAPDGARGVAAYLDGQKAATA
ncbi:MAG: DUF58 domain-containing protein [Opitutaceae bacterium]|nr:DUF58 domain-containing protein [Opitutaceae bacterium]